MDMLVTQYSVDFNVAQISERQFVAVCNLGGFTLRGNVCGSHQEATRSLFQLLGGAAGYNSPDADLAIALALGGTDIQSVGAKPELPANAKTVKR